MPWEVGEKGQNQKIHTNNNGSISEKATKKKQNRQAAEAVVKGAEVGTKRKAGNIEERKVCPKKGRIRKGVKTKPSEKTRGRNKTHNQPPTPSLKDEKKTALREADPERQSVFGGKGREKPRRFVGFGGGKRNGDSKKIFPGPRGMEEPGGNGVQG